MAKNNKPQITQINTDKKNLWKSEKSVDKKTQTMAYTDEEKKHSIIESKPNKGEYLITISFTKLLNAEI